MEKPIIRKENIETLMESRFIKVFDLQYAPGKHYYDASRRPLDNLVAHKSDEEFKAMLPDAVSCFVILKIANDAPKLLTSYEYRYPAGQFLLSPPAGLIDPEDAQLASVPAQETSAGSDSDNADAESSQSASDANCTSKSTQRPQDAAILSAAAREIHEETGLVVKETDRIFVVNPLLFSSPGMTDESNALVLAVYDLPDLAELNQDGAEGSELCIRKGAGEDDISGDYEVYEKEEEMTAGGKTVLAKANADGIYTVTWTEDG
jgi:ADP-ribose pyrophosphatase